MGLGWAREPAFSMSFQVMPLLQVHGFTLGLAVRHKAGGGVRSARGL